MQALFIILDISCAIVPPDEYTNPPAMARPKYKPESKPEPSKPASPLQPDPRPTPSTSFLLGPHAPKASSRLLSRYASQLHDDSDSGDDEADREYMDEDDADAKRKNGIAVAWMFFTMDAGLAVEILPSFAEKGKVGDKSELDNVLLEDIAAWQLWLYLTGKMRRV